MEIKYKIYNISIIFEKPIHFYNYPTFIFHSVLGKELKRISCLFRDRQCGSCSLKHTCAYSRIFESHIDKENEAIPGRNRAAHPYVLHFQPHGTDKTGEEKDTIKGGVLSVTLMGKEIEYFPYIYFALKRAGEKGLFKERHSFSIEDVVFNNKSILIDSETIDVKDEDKSWQPSLDQTNPKNNHIQVEFLSPVRLKIKGRYAVKIFSGDLIQSLLNRMKLIHSLYGNGPVEDIFKDNKNFTQTMGDKIKSSNSVQEWKDYSYFSARQKSKLKLGGITGLIELEGNFSRELLSLLTFGEIFHIGKNTSFGFGKIKVHGKESPWE